MKRTLQCVLHLINILFLLVIISPQFNAAAGGGIGLFSGPVQTLKNTGRLYYSPHALVSLDFPGTVFIGDSFSFTAELSNSPDNPDDVGYGPFIDIYFPASGIDGDDGLSFDTGNPPTYLGQELEYTLQTIPDDDGFGNGEVEHPLALDTNGDPYVISGHAGDQFVTIELPFGSVTGDFPPIEIEVSAVLSNQADLSQGLTLYARGGFELGSDPLNNPCCDQVILSPYNSPPSGWTSKTLYPALMSISKEYNGPENETATGPNFPHRYTIAVDIAEGQQISDFLVQDQLPDNMEYLSLVSVSPSTCSTDPLVGGDEPVTPGAQLPPDNDLTVYCPSVNGTNDFQMVYSFFIPETDANTPSAPVLDPATGNDKTSNNSVSFISGEWDPLDTDDGEDLILDSSVCPDCPGTHTLYDKSIAVQKSVSIAHEAGETGYSPGDILKYTINFQVSDYFTFDQIVVTDVISDGQRFVDSATTGAGDPTLTLNDRDTGITNFGFSYANNIYNYGDTVPSVPASSEDLIVDQTKIEGTGPGGDSTDGTTTLEFFVYQAMLNSGETDHVLTGGEVGSSDTAATGQIVFYTQIQQDFSDDYNSGDESVDQGDILRNNVTIDGRVLDNTTHAVLDTEPDTSSNQFSILRGSVEKNIYAINGITSFSSPVTILPGDEVTYRLLYTTPSSDFEDMVLEDFLPLPVFHVDDPNADGSSGHTWTFDTTVSADAPTSGSAKFGPSETLHVNGGGGYNYTPSITSDVTANSLAFGIGTYDDPADSSSKIDILFTVTVSTEPFSDQLKLTNLVKESEGSTNATDASFNQIIQFVLNEPVIVVKKGVTGSDNPDQTLSGHATPAGWSDPGDAVSSNDLTDDRVFNSNVSNVDAEDTISFAIVVENQGHSTNGVYDIIITDTVPSGLRYPGGDVNNLNLQVYRGDGAAIAYTPLGPSGTDADLFANGIELVDPGPTGVCETVDDTNGRNIITITYDLQVDPNIAPGTRITNLAEVTNYAGSEGGPDHTGPDANNQYQDSSRVTISQPKVVKLVSNTSYDDTGILDGTDPAITDLDIREQVSFEITVTIPEGLSDPLTVTDELPLTPGLLGVVSAQVLGIGASLEDSTNPGVSPTAAITISDSDTDGINDQVEFAFGSVHNIPDGVTNDDDRIKLEVVAWVPEHADNAAGDVLTNEVTAEAGANGRGTDEEDVELVEIDADLSVTKTDNVSIVGAGELLTYVLTYENLGTQKATGVVITETVPDGTTFDETASSAGWVLQGTTTPVPDDSPAGTVCEFPVGELAAGSGTSTVDFAVMVDNPLDAAISEVYNAASIDDDGLSGNDLDTTNNYTEDTDNIGRIFVKAMEGGEQPGSTDPQVFIGEIVTYSLTMHIPPGTISDVQVVDDLDPGLAYLDCVEIIPESADLTTDLAGGFDDACDHAVPPPGDPTTGSPAIYPLPLGSTEPEEQARRIVFDLGNIENIAADSKTLVVRYQTLVTDIDDVTRGSTLNNQATWSWDTIEQLIASAGNVRVVESGLNLSLTADTTHAFPGDLITFTLDLEHTLESNSPAYELELTDTLPSELIYEAGTLAWISGEVPTVLDDTASPTLTASWDEFPVGATSELSFQARLGAVSRGTKVTNTASLAWSSLPGDVKTAQSDYNERSTERYFVPSSDVDNYNSISDWLITFPKQLDRNLPETGFPPNRHTQLPVQPASQAYMDIGGLWLEVPALQLQMPIMGIPLTEDGWDLTWLWDQAGYLEGTAFPTLPGNTVLTAHVVLPDGNPGPFAHLDGLGYGDKLVIHNGELDYIYQVQSVSTIRPSQTALFEHEAYDTVSLITCSGYNRYTGKYDYRVVVKAVLVDVE